VSLFDVLSVSFSHSVLYSILLPVFSGESDGDLISIHIMHNNSIAHNNKMVEQVKNTSDRLKKSSKREKQVLYST